MKDVACGPQHTIALTHDGRVFSWGYGENGRLGHGTKENVLVPTQIAKFKDVKIESVACGGGHSLAIDSKGRLWGWGLAEKNRLAGGIDDYFTPTLISAFNDHKVRAVKPGLDCTFVITE